VLQRKNIERKELLVTVSGLKWLKMQLTKWWTLLVIVNNNGWNLVFVKWCETATLQRPKESMIR